MFKIVLLLVCLAQVSFQKELTKNAPSVRIDSRCPEHDGETPVYLAHDVNCWQFYVCSNQNVIELTCPPATYFNPNKNVCDAPGNVDCGTLHTTQNAPSPTVPSVSQLECCPSSILGLFTFIFEGLLIRSGQCPWMCPINSRKKWKKKCPSTTVSANKRLWPRNFNDAARL